LAAHKGHSLVYVGSQASAEAQAIGLLLNEKLGNLGHSVNFVEVDADESVEISALAEAIKAGSVETLVILGGNPVYNAPADLGFGDLLGKVSTVARLGYENDETTEKATYHFLQSHYLESWGDGRSYDGDVLPQQPMILPLFDGISEIELIAELVGEEETDGHSLVYATYGKDKRAFDKLLHDGFSSGSGYKTNRSLVSGMRLAEFLKNEVAPSDASKDSLEAVFTIDAKADDGRFVNNGWLQECPDPMTNLTWDSALQIAHKNPNKVRDGRVYSPIAKVTVGGRTVQGAVFIMPGLDNYSIVLPLGYGRASSGRVGSGSGYDAFSVRSGTQSFATGATLELTGEEYQLASTQEHWSMEGRAIVRESNLDDYAKSPDWVDHMGMESHSPPVYGADKDMPTQEKITTTPKGGSMYEHPDLTGVHQWGMNIDLNLCTGCNACVVACQSENNIPIVGRDQVRRGREMHWIRLDRYFSSNEEKGSIPEDPQVSLQPIACMHCETAPCETVCPVNATVHDSEGLNAMAYNRCIGTRYCANNCPYKVRRFNFFDYQQRDLDKLYMGPLAPKGKPELLQMAQNPDVSVRMRGVMEKCTFCTQRIQSAKIAQKSKAKDSNDVKVPDGTIKTACSQVCPTEAIVFGDLSDANSRVAKLAENERGYDLMGYTNARPRTKFLGKLRNPNTKMPDYVDQPLSKSEYDTASHGSHGEHGSHDDNGHAEDGHGQEEHSDSHSDNGGHH